MFIRTFIIACFYVYPVKYLDFTCFLCKKKYFYCIITHKDLDMADCIKQLQDELVRPAETHIWLTVLNDYEMSW